MEKLLDLDKEWYFIVLVRQSVKLPTTFYLSQLWTTSSDQGHPQLRLTPQDIFQQGSISQGPLPSSNPLQQNNVPSQGPIQ